MSKTEMIAISSDLIKSALKDRGLTQLKLADKTGLDKDHLSKGLRKGRLSIYYLNTIARELDYSIDYLTGEYVPEIKGTDPVSIALRRELIRYNSKSNRDAQSQIDYYMRGITLINGLDESFYDSLSEIEKKELQKAISDAIDSFSFIKSLQWE